MKDYSAGRIEKTIRNASAAGRPAIIAYLTGGFPNHRRFMETLRAVAAAADVVEIGVPYSDPMADGATIQRASKQALENGTSLDRLLASIGAARCDFSAPLVFMSYLNPLMQYGERRLVEALVKAGVDGLIVPDLPREEGEGLRGALTEAGVALIVMVSPFTPEERLRVLCADAAGFVYAVTDAGTTGGAAAITPKIEAYLAKVRAVSAAPVCAGFGIRTARQVRELASSIDGVVVGSAIVEAIERGEDPAELIRSLQIAAR